MARDFPRSGEDVAWDLQDYGYKPSLEDFKKYRSHMEKKKVDWGEAAWAGAGEIANRVGKGILGLAEFESAEQIPGTAIEGVAAGTYSLYGVLAQSDNPASSLFKFKDWISGTGTDIGQYDQFIEARKVWKNIREAEEGGETISGIDPAYVNQDVRNALELVADPSVFIPFAGGPKAAALAARAAGRVGHAAGTGVRAVGRAGAGLGAAPEFATTLGARAIGAPAEAAGLAGRGARSLTTAAGVGEVGLGAAGAGFGLPFGGAAAAFTGAKYIGGGLDAAGEAMQHLSRSMGTGASRTGAFAALAADESASLGARTLGGIGRRFGADALAPYVGSAAAGVGIGAGVGGTLGYLSQGEEGLFGGLGGGLVLGAAGGLAGRGISHLTGGVRSQRIMGDASRAIALMPEAEGAKAQILVERFAKEGDTEAIATLLNTRGWLGEEIPLKFVRDDEVVMKPDGTPAMVKDADGNMVPLRSTDTPFKGVHIDDANNAIYINVDRAEGGTVLHEALHGALRTTLGKAYAKPMADALMKNLNENQLGAYIWRYVDYKGLKGKAREQAKNDFLADPLKALEEINADYFMDFLQRRENRDLLLTGKRSVDNIILGNLKNAYDSVLHKLGMSEEYKLTGRRDDPFTGHKAVDSLVRELIDARRAINKAAPKTGKPNITVDVMSPEKAVIFAKEHGQTDALKYDDDGNVTGVKTEKEVIAERAEISAKVKSALKGIKNTKSFLSDEQLAVMQPLLHPEHFAKLVAMNEAVKNGTVLNGVYTPVGTKKGESTVYANRGVTERNYLPYKIKVGGKGQILIDFLDLSMLRSRADDYLSRPGKLDPWGGDKAAAIADLKRYIENLSSEKPVPSAEFFGGGEIGIQKRDILQKIYGFVRRKKWRDEGVFINENLSQKFPTPEESQPGDYMIGKQLWEKDSPRVVKSFSLERFGKITDTGEGLAFTEGKAAPKTGEVTTPGGYVLSQLNFQPDSFTPEKLPGGEAFVHESGYNILQKGRGKFRVYKPDGELLGLRDTMKSAASLAGRNFRKGVARFQPSPEIDPLGMFSKAESAALELKQAKGSGQQMLAMLKKAGVKAEEMQYLGLDKFLEGKKSVTRDEIHDHIVQNQITVEETVLGRDQGEVVNARLTASDNAVKDWADEVLTDMGIEGMADNASLDYGRSFDAQGKDFIELKNFPPEQFAMVKEFADKYGAAVGSEEVIGTLPTKHPDQVEPGAVEGSYRELLLRLPGKGVSFRKYVTDWEALTGQRFDKASPNKQEQIQQGYDAFVKKQTSERAGDYTSGHYGEYPNTLAHIRFNERTGPKGEKVLFVEEIQSDWHQEGRKKGYREPAKISPLEQQVKELKGEEARLTREVEETGSQEAGDRLGEVYRNRLAAERVLNQASQTTVPDAPFKTSWHELAMKRMIKYAADNGYDAIAWTKGETQAARYDLSKQVDELFIGLDPETQKVSISADDKVLAGDIPVSKMEDYIGKDVAKRASDKLNEPQALDPMSGIRQVTLKGTDLKVGGEFHKNLYDRKLTRMKTWKKLGLKVEEGSFKKPTRQKSGMRRLYREGESNLHAHIVRLSPEVKAKVREEGMARFQPAESLTNGTAWRTADGYNVLQKGKRGKFRAYAPSGKLIGIYDQLKTAQKAAIRLQEKETNLTNQ